MTPTLDLSGKTKVVSCQGQRLIFQGGQVFDGKGVWVGPEPKLDLAPLPFAAVVEAVRSLRPTMSEEAAPEFVVVQPRKRGRPRKVVNDVASSQPS